MSPASKNSFGTLETLLVDGKAYEIFGLKALEKKAIGHPGKLPFSLRGCWKTYCGRKTAASSTPRILRRWPDGIPNAATQKEIAFMPARVLLQDFTGVPAVVDLAAMREVIRKMGGDPKKVNPLQPADLVIDHSVQVDKFGSDGRLRSTRNSRTSATSSATRSSAGAQRRSTISTLCRPTPASATR